MGRFKCGHAVCIIFKFHHQSCWLRSGPGSSEEKWQIPWSYRHYFFVDFAVETYGPWCSEAKNLIKSVGHQLQSLNHDPRSTSYLYQRIGIIIQKGNAASIMGTFPSSASLDEIFYFLYISGRPWESVHLLK